MSIANDVRAYADLAVEQSKIALHQAKATAGTVNKRLAEDATKPALAAIGAADLAAESLRKRLENAPSLVSNVGKAPESGRAALSKAVAKAQSDALAMVVDVRKKLDNGLDADQAKELADEYLNLAKNVFQSLVGRGEAKVTELRKDPRLAKFLGELADFGDSIDDGIGDVIEQASKAGKKVVSGFDAVADTVAVKAPARPARTRAASKVTPTKATSAKATSAKATSAKATSAKATSARATAVKTPPVKTAPVKTTAKSTPPKPTAN